MNRRDWLKQAMAGVAALAVDPERLLWTPGARTIFVPPPRVLPPVFYKNYSVIFRLTKAQIDVINSGTYSFDSFAYLPGREPSDRDRRT